MHPNSGSGEGPGEPRQRWRLTFQRQADAPAITHRELTDSWLLALGDVLPLARAGGSRPRPALTFAVALPVATAAERELADLYLADRLPIWRVREAVSSTVPVGIAVSSLHDVWLGAPPLPASVSAADYRVVIHAAPPGALRDAAARLLASATVERRRPRGSDTVPYDLRPLVISIAVRAAESPDAGPTVMIVRTRFHPERGTGRPEEVVAALGEILGAPLAVAETVRERVLLSDEV